MNLHEYQAKQLFASYGMPVPANIVAETADEAVAASVKLGGNKWVLKAQVHAGGRGKAGGVQLVENEAAISSFATRMLGSHLVTKQTDAKGQPVNLLLVEACTEIARELYLGALVDRTAGQIAVLASSAGGMDIEEVASQTPEKIVKVLIDPLVGAQPYQARYLAFQLGLTQEQLKHFVKLFLQLVQLFNDKDLSLVEINPLVITQEGKLVCLDGKVNIDNNALFRQKELSEQRDISQEDQRENEAAAHGLSYVALDGDIGCMVNGAGLAMATMDIIKTCGGNPANFLDVGGSVTRERVTEAFKIILSDSKVKVVLVNIFGGIVRCDIIARGLIEAVKEIKIDRLVVRLAGNNADLATELLAKSGLAITTAASLQEAAEKAVKIALE